MESPLRREAHGGFGERPGETDRQQCQHRAPGRLSLGAWLANTRECLAMLLRPGNAGSNTFTGHRDVLTAAIRQIPARFRARVLVRVDGAGAGHELVKHLLSMTSPRRKVLFTCGWMITPADEAAIMQVPAGAWKPGIGQDGAAEEDKDVAEVTHLMSRAGNWPLCATS